MNLGEGDEFLAVKPWKGQMKPPTWFKRPKKDAGDAPALDVVLDWVHGYRGSKSRNNLHYLANGAVGYYAAGVYVEYDPVKHAQRHFN